MLARQQTERLGQTDLQPGDVVIFYDGANDVFYPVYNGNPEGYRLGDSSDGGVRKLNGLQAWLYPLCFRLKDYSYAASLLFHGMDVPRPANVVEAATLARHLDAAEKGYRDALTRARRFLLVIGDSATLGADPFYRRLLAYFEQAGAYRSVWEE